ncbi:efflux RND transporter periplasmic adaptor subunit [Rhodohalobacter barkolensis]|uniref:Efflux transporter periplasmic adaptor subunit n=1 Tax=Rhodohalobacter barkolensis TaxID=2053187 RepID=A0A2N0VEX7_9BACT|nr:HlyD family efflux transporter periplasmic adaptor subunit [Rhodohalobacter barkolensis]PKD42743.1 efflux transporter periplasmic adaptor subunit [Rhodohalobacter barkolensis]
MDKKIEKRKSSPLKIAGTLLLVGIAAIVLYNFLGRESGSSATIDRQRVMISEVTEGVFQEYVDVSGTVQPIQTTYLDAVEGGVVQQIFTESGEMVEAGDTIVVLTNSSLQLSVLQQEAGIYDQINNVRNSRLNLEQNHLNIQKELTDSKTRVELAQASYRRDSVLYERELIPSKEIEESELEYSFQKSRYDLNYESFRRDSVQMEQQLTQLNQSEQRMWRSLDGVQQILDNLVVTAPISGQLSTMELDPGLSIQQGERIGQIDQLDGFKVRAGIDEFYLARVAAGQSGSFEFAGENYDVVIDRVYPVIQDGQFQVDFQFEDVVPQSLRRGQSVRIRLELGDSGNALLLPRGAFFQQTGGNWVFVMDEDENRALKHAVRLGRSNREYYEVIEGLEPGQNVITSSYDAFEQADVLIFQD